jgi:hypothetical protein
MAYREVGILTFLLPEAEDEAVRQHYRIASESCTQIKWHLLDSDESASESEIDSDGNNVPAKIGPQRANAMVRRVKTYTNCLMALGNALDSPAPDDAQDEMPSLVEPEQRSAHDYHRDLIKAKYPDADAVLLQTLGQASWARFLRMQNERDDNARQCAELQGPTIAVPAKSLVSVSEFQDSGLGTSLPAVLSSYAESTVSFMTSISGGERVRIPPLPAEAKKGHPFDCTACGRSVRASNNREWR